MPDAELEELDTFTTRGWKEEPALRPLEQDVLCLARYGTADKDLLATLDPSVVNLDGDFTDFPPDEWYRQRQKSEYQTAAYVGNLMIFAQNIHDEKLRKDRDGAASGASAFSHSRDSGAG